MFDRILAFLGGTGPAEGAETAAAAPTRRAAVALLSYAAMLDGSLDPAERREICRQLTERYGLDGAEREAVIDGAEAEARSATGLFGFTRDINAALDDEGRVGVIEMLWEVVLADGEVHDLEANLIRRVAGLLYVSDTASGLARQRVLERRAIPSP